MYLLCSLLSLQLGVFLVALCLVPSLGMQNDWWKEPTKLLSASVLHALPFRHVDIRICCTVSSDQICSEPQGSTCWLLQPGDKILKVSASFGTDIWEAINYGHVMYSIKTRNGQVYLQLRSNGGDTSIMQVSYTAIYCWASVNRVMHVSCVKLINDRRCICCWQRWCWLHQAQLQECTTCQQCVYSFKFVATYVLSHIPVGLLHTCTIFVHVCIYICGQAILLLVFWGLLLYPSCCLAFFSVVYQCTLM